MAGTSLLVKCLRNLCSPRLSTFLPPGSFVPYNIHVCVGLLRSLTRAELLYSDSFRTLPPSSSEGAPPWPFADWARDAISPDAPLSPHCRRDLFVFPPAEHCDLRMLPDDFFKSFSSFPPPPPPCLFSFLPVVS